MQETNHKKTAWMADFLCLLVAAIWGSGFIASQTAINAGMSAALIMVLRFTLAALVMLVFCIPRLKKISNRELKKGAFAGIFLFGAFYTQIIGQQNTVVSHCAFITATNVVMVPFLVWIISRKAPPVHTFIYAGTTFLGIGILSIKPDDFGLSFYSGDIMSLVCALLFAMHITSLGWAAKDTDVMLLNLVQLSTAALISGAVFLFTDLETVASVNWTLGLPSVIYLGLLSTCLCYFLQTLAQKYITPSQAGVLLSTEGLFGSIFSVILGMEILTINMVVGGFIILFSVIMTEVSSTNR